MEPIDYHVVFSRNLRTERKKRNFSQAELAELSGLSESAVKNLEIACISNPTLETMCLLAEPLKTTPGQLLNPDFSAENSALDELFDIHYLMLAQDACCPVLEFLSKRK